MVEVLLIIGNIECGVSHAENHESSEMLSAANAAMVRKRMTTEQEMVD